MIEDVLNKMRNWGLTIFKPKLSGSLINEYFPDGKEYTGFIACEILDENYTDWLISGVRVPIEGLTRLKTTQLLIKSHTKKPVWISKSDFEVIP